MQKLRDGSKFRILLVDDERDITRVLKTYLDNEGFDVDDFNSPAEALSQFKPGHYNLVITDIRMPGMSGFELAREIWEHEPGMSVCLMSSFEIYEDEARKVFPSLKNFCFIKKPIAPSALVKHIQSHIAA